MIGQPRLYLAGPDVFRADVREHGARLVALCARYGFIGLFPADPEVMDRLETLRAEGRDQQDGPEMIFQEDIAKVEACDGVLANLTPFRGPSADPGTCVEIGWAKGLRKPVWGYSDDLRPWYEKTLDWNGGPFVNGADGVPYARDGMTVDLFPETDNLMMTRSCEGAVVHGSFERALLAARDWFVARHA